MVDTSLVSRWVAAMAVLALHPGFAAQDSSRHCVLDKDATPAIFDGEYEGTFSMAVSFEQSLQGSPMRQTLRGSGAFHLSVDRGKFDAGPARDRSSMSGHMSTSTAMSWKLPASSRADQALAGKAQLMLDGEVDDSGFDAKGHHRTAGLITGVTPYAIPRPREQSLEDDVRLGFHVLRGNCDGASGDLLSPSMAQMVDSMEKSGFAVTREPWTWTMTRVPSASDPRAKLKEDLQASAKTAESAEAEFQRLSQIAERIDTSQPVAFRQCLMVLWMEHANQRFRQHVSQHVKALNTDPGSWPALERQLREATGTARLAPLVGLDKCSEQAQAQLFEAIRAALSRQLQRMVDGKAPQAELLEVLWRAELLGDVAPGLRARVDAALKKQAEDSLAAALAALRRAVETAKAAKRTPASDPAVLEAWRRTARAMKSAELLGGDSTAAGVYAQQQGLMP